MWWYCAIATLQNLFLYHTRNFIEQFLLIIYYVSLCSLKLFSTLILYAVGQFMFDSVQIFYTPYQEFYQQSKLYLQARWKAEARQSNTKDTAASQEKFNDKIPFSAPNEDHRDAELAETNLADGLQIPMNSSGNLGQCEHKIETENPKPKLQADETLKRNIINANSKQTKRPTRNGNCPCGSKRKYKNCCLPAKQASARNIDQAAQLQGDVIQTLQIETIFVWDYSLIAYNILKPCDPYLAMLTLCNSSFPYFLKELKALQATADLRQIQLEIVYIE